MSGKPLSIGEVEFMRRSLHKLLRPEDLGHSGVDKLCDMAKKSATYRHEPLALAQPEGAA